MNEIIDDWDTPPARPSITISMIREAQDVDTQPADFWQTLHDIKSPRYAKVVAAVQTAYEKGGKDAAAPFKKKLPGILFSGSFKKRNAKDLIQHSGLICVDLDHLDNKVDNIKEHVCADPHVLSAFRSPTGSGLKVVLKCDPTKDHLESFKAAEQFMLERFGLEIDKACKDVNRICFVSHDPEIFIADNAEVIPYPPPVSDYHPVDYTNGTGDGPGDDYDRRGDWASVLLKHGWSKIGAHGWRRPDKTDGISATWDKVPGRFYVFSSSTEFEPQHTYRPWHVYAKLECGGDFKRAAQELGRKGFGRQRDNRLPLDRMIQDDKNADTKPDVDLVARGLFEFAVPKDGDESILLGDRYLNRGDGAVLVSTSGMGKSSMNLQMAFEYALNKGPFGIKGNGPLRSLIIQSEDSDGDIGEVAASLRHVSQLSDADAVLVNERVKIVTDRIYRGPKFIASLKRQIELHKPDLVWINPLQAFIKGNVTDSQDIGEFLREGLNGLNHPPSFAYIIVHHTTKPSTGKDRGERLWHEVMYDMAGGAEIINWARAILSLRAATNEGEYNLVLAKRGRRAGVRKTSMKEGQFVEEVVTTIPLKHATGRIEIPGVKRGVPLIYWESREADPVPDQPKMNMGGRPEVYPWRVFEDQIPAHLEKALPLKELGRRCSVNKPITDKQLYNVLEKYVDQGYVQIVKENGTKYKKTAPRDNSSPAFKDG